MVTIKELQRNIDRERKKLKKAQAISAKDIERIKLRKELFQLKHRRGIASAGKGKRLLIKAGKGLVKVGKKAAPILQKQARLIRDQQLRDDAIARKLKKKKTGTTTKTITKLVPIKGKKKLFKKVKIKVKSPIIQKKKEQGFNFMNDLDF